MLITDSKKWFIRIIILFASIFGLAQSAFAQGPTINGVIINSCVGEISLSVSSEISALPLTFVWQDSGGAIVGGNSFLLNGVGADDYRVTVTDKNGKTITAVYTITSPPDLVGSVVVNDVSCKEGSDAQVVVSMANGNPDYSWVLTNSGGGTVGTGNASGTTITITGLGVDNYKLVLTDEDGCDGTITFSVTEPANFLGGSLVSKTDATCSDSANGSLQVTGTGGWGNYTYAWYTEPGATYLGAGATINSLLPGDYKVYITDDKGCVVERTYTIDSPDPIAITSSITDASCNTGNDGAINISVTGGNGTYTYSWSNGPTSEDISGLTAGSYTITVTDGNGCTFSKTFTVGEPNALAINPTITAVKCFGDNTGKIETNPSGGTAPYTYSWSTGQTVKTINNQTAGSYTLTVTDKNGCTVSGTYTINQPAAALSVQSITNNSPSCFGESDGSLSVVMQGGTAPYSYVWSSGSNTATASALASGNYTITVTDANGCTYTNNYTVTDPPKVIVTPTLNEPSCNGQADGSITVLASNGTGPYTYNWNTGASGATLSNIPAGTYTVTVKDDGTSCTVTQSVTLGEPSLIVDNAVVADISCNGQVDGSITLAPTGGTGTYTYLWNNASTSSSITGLSAGSYSVTITDDSGCSINKSFTIVEPDPLTSTVVKQDVLCKGQSTGSIDLTPDDGTAPYTFSWSNGAVTEDLVNVPAGNYSVTITDASGCSIVKAITIDEPAEVLVLSGTATNVTCNGGANGKIDFTVTGGVAPYAYVWNTGAVSQDLNNIAPGVYTVKVTDANGCIKFDSFTISEPAALAVSPAKTDITCNGADDGIINLNVSGGTAPYIYIWNDGSIQQNRTGLTNGNYTVTVTDDNGCQNTQVITISEPAVLSATSVKQDVLCFGNATGVANITVSGGTLPYSYSWSNGAITEDLNGVVAGSYTATITDANGCVTTEVVQINQPAAALTFTPTVGQITCNGATDGAISLSVSGGTAPYTYTWSNGSTSQNLSSLSPGTYSVTIRDANNCQVTGSYDITDPPILNLSGTATDISCFGADDGKINITVSGGEAPYTFVWSNGDNTEDVSGLAPGSHTVQIVDSRGCSTSKSFTISQPTALNIAYTNTDVNCFGGNNAAIDLTVTGGTAPYSYSWDSGQAQADIQDLIAGTYTVTITDGNGCESVKSITINQPAAALSITNTVTNLSCFGSNNGSIALVPSGGTAPYTYSWSNGKTTRDIFGLTPGAYQVTVTDANGCTVQETFNITMPSALNVTASTSNLTCNGTLNGAIDLTVTGGTAPYTYAWNNGATTQDLTNISGGTYQVTITDANSCSLNRTYTITEPLALVATVTKQDVTCFGQGDGDIDVTISGGNAPYSYSWSNGAITKDLANISGGTYTLTVTDNKGCQTVKTVIIDEPTAALAATGTTTDVSCFGGNNGAVDLTVTGGTAPYTYAWNNGKTTQDVSGLTAGNYQVVVTDARGCTVSVTFTIGSPSQVQATASVTNITCNGADNGAIDLSPSGGTAPYTFLWSNGATSEDLSSQTPGNYSVQITDTNGCSISKSFQITEPAAMQLSFTKTDVLCFGNTTGAINITVTGGVGGYTYAWSNGATSEDVSSLAAGNYSVTVTDVNGCSITQNIQITQPIAALSVSETNTNLTCFGANDGTIDLTVTGGTAPYSYAWSNSKTTQDLFGLAAGTYNVTITDANGCSVQKSYNITTPDALTSTSSAQNISSNGLTDGSIDLTVTGGTAPYAYAWSNGATTEDLSNLAVGSYQVQITDAQGCSVSRSYNITQPLPITLNHTANNVSCFQASDGDITIQVSGGTAPYTYLWSNGSTTKDISSLAGGNYELTVTDAKGYTTTKNITISAPSSALNAAATITDVGCNGLPNARIDLTVTGGTAPYTYLWSNGAVQRDLVNVFAGNYNVKVTDKNGCTFSASYSIDQPNAITADIAVTNTTCFGDANGSVIVTPSGGTAPYTYVWSSGATSKDLINVAGGTYNLTITDANNCSSTSSVEIGDSRSLNVSVQKTDVLCKGESNGAIVLNVKGGSGTYSYVWDNGSEGKVLNNLSAGVYKVKISDAAGCATTASVVISEPTLALGVTVDRTEEFACFGENTGFANAIPSGGVAPYTYLWSNGARTRQINNLMAGNYTVSVTDANGCLVQQSFSIQQPAKPVSISAKGGLQLSCAGDGDGALELSVEGGTAPYTYLWSTGSTDPKIENLTAGDYTIRVSDAKGCITEKVFSVEEPSPLVIADARINESQCFDDRNGSIDLDVSGGVFPYTYQWSNGATTKNLVGISAGTFIVEITDANGCSVQGSYTLSTPERFIAAPFISEVSCVGANDASISLNIEGGIAPLSIQWNTGASTEVITGLAPGQYNVLISDKKGCTIQKLFNIIEPLPLTLDAYIEEAARCNDPKSGRVNVIVSGGREPYTYRWNNGQTTSELINVLPGTYVVTVSDRYGCEVQGTYTVQQPEPLRIGLTSVREVDCENRLAGMRVKANVTGGSGDYSYRWSLGSSNNNEVFLTQPGRLSLEILDNRGCVQSKAIDISIPDFGEAEFSYNAESLREMGDLAANDPVNFYDESVGDIIDWDWEFGDGFDSDEIDPIHTYDSPGKYTVTLITTDNTGCTSSKTTVLEITEGYRIMTPNAFSPNGDGNNDYFRPEFLGLVTVQFSVFNTWGELVFSTTLLETKGWDGIVKGIPAENGNYVYKISGFTQNGLKAERNGVFSLIK
ncbi:PKD domain-containing protein [Roseivirga sp.]|uniref:PKD domain-containing protein n=1 Tax=Roseivirga sp. TaxID=1964215 RepID=UPI002B271BEF|nr:PKD domain-containing protein [Roseivirga sp.]